MTPPGRRTFLEQYAVIRHAEGRGSADRCYYESLPWKDVTGRNSEQWKIRARSYRHFERTILRAAERESGRALRILDLGAGNCWMSYRLSLRGHFAVALDIFIDDLDGLGARRNFNGPPPPVAADFDALPFADQTFDLAIFNSSVHYSPDYRRTLAEARRCLRPSGTLVIIDSPVYRLAEHGEQMRAERQAYFERTYGFRSDALGSIEYLDTRTLAALSNTFGVEWTARRPWYGWRWALRPLRARIRRQRPPSRFLILSGRFPAR
ncbi:MAG TPA: class I SAM-dependent methyltransferase [Bryobacteraceae bacterium]|nr:class I SAM-dependent methyltransferase [Bryobacteraceae bacterium]